MTSATPRQSKAESGPMRGYAAALKKAGVAKDDFQLLRELAELNAGELAQPSDHVPPSRLLVKVGRAPSA